MSIIKSVRSNFVPIHKEGYPFIAGFFVASLLLGWLWEPLFWIGLVITLWCIYFFRDPERIIPVNKNILVSPADGKISFVGLTKVPEELGFLEEEMLRVSVFMDVFSCHVNRAPIAGKIKAVIHRPGTFANAELDKASEDNERNSLVLTTSHGDIGVVQIAGLVARRIVCWSKQNDDLQVGQRFGLIRFGSRLDIYMPKNAKIRVAVGQTAIAGETVFACFDKTAKLSEFRLD